MMRLRVSFVQFGYQLALARDGKSPTYVTGHALKPRAKSVSRWARRVRNCLWLVSVGIGLLDVPHHRRIESMKLAKSATERSPERSLSALLKKVSR